MVQFDWYQATLNERPWSIAEACLQGIPGAFQVIEGRGRNGYRECLRVVDSDGQRLAEVHSGGPNGPPNALASGETAQRFADVIRTAWPDAHRVTRADACQDVAGDFGELHARLTEQARLRGLKFRTIVPGDPADGATLYLGSKDSRVSARIYEKGKQLRAMGHPVTVDQLALVRFEVQLRPTRDGRATVARLSPADCWGASPWAREVADRFLGFDPGRTPTQFRLTSDFESRVHHMVDQYGPTLVELRRRAGGDLQFLMALVALLEPNQAE